MSDVQVTLQDGNVVVTAGENTAAASASAALAESWANEAEDTVVANGEYSAKHYAAKAGGSATAAASSAAELGGVFAPEATSVNANVLACTGKIVMWDADDHKYRIRTFNRSAGFVQWVLFDDDINDEVGSFTISSPDYSSSGANIPDRVAFIATDPLSGIPADDPDGANFTGLQGYIELSAANKAAIAALANQVLQPTNQAEGGINPRNVYTTLSTPARPRDPRLWIYRQSLDVGAGRDFTTVRAAVESLYRDGPLAAQNGVLVQPVSLIATAIEPVAIILDPGTYQESNLHLPDWVSLIARYPGTVRFEHSSGATRPIIQAHLNHQLVDIHWENTAAEGTDYATNAANSSARYAVHRDFLHLFQSVNAEGDYQRAALLQIIGGSMTVGVNGGIQPLGIGMPVGDTTELLDVDLGCKSATYAGPLAAANNSSNTFGGGRFIFRNCRDISGRASNAPTVGVQVKQDNTHPNQLILDSVKGFDTIALSGTTAGNWTMHGNWTGTISDTIPGGDSGFFQ